MERYEFDGSGEDIKQDEMDDIVDIDKDEENEMVVEEKINDLVEGKFFDTSDELFNYYVRYGNENGFPVKRRTSKKGDDGKIRWVMFACARSGKSRSNSKNAFKVRPITKTDCNARVDVVLCPDGRWQVTRVHDAHNHNLSPGKSRYYKNNRVITPFVGRRLEMNDRAGIRPNKSYNSIVVESGGHENVPFLQKDCYNLIDKMRRLRLGEGDASAIQKYFSRMQADNSNFYYVIDLNMEARIKNVFWADARSRAAYEEFGDVITFDTTYLTNKYDMPFAPFVGVNHHGHSILLGCALISNEDTETFTWLFNTWLECMGNRAPNAIITDQARAMQNAIEKVFPLARHRWCLWHILKKVPEKLGGYKEYESITFAIHNAVYDSLSTNEFEESWNKLIEKFNLEKNDWLSGLYIDRHHWVPAFVKDIFWAGMSTTQRSESMNAFFDGYVNSKTTLKQFVEQYENALRTKVEKESQEDFNSFNSRIPCITHFEIEKQFQGIYTIAKFKEFQKEFVGKIYCSVSSMKANKDFAVYEISEEKIGGMDKENTFTVVCCQSECDIKCNCRLFEFRGILCRHAIVVLIQQKVKIVPEKYILRRWRKDIKRCHTKVKIMYFDWLQNPENEQFEKMCSAFYQVADLATGIEKKIMHVMQWITQLRDDLNKDEVACENSQLIHPYTSSTGGDLNPTIKDSGIIHSPVAVRRGGRPPSKRKISIGEEIVQKKKKSEKVKGKKKTKKRTGQDINNDVNLEKTADGGSVGMEVGQTQDCITLQDPNDGLVGVQFGETQESITIKDPIGGLSNTMEFGMFQQLPQGRSSFIGNYPMTHNIPGQSVVYRADLSPHIQNFDNRTHVPYNGNLPLGSQAMLDVNANYPIQMQGYHYPFWNGRDMPSGGL